MIGWIAFAAVLGALCGAGAVALYLNRHLPETPDDVRNVYRMPVVLSDEDGSAGLPPGAPPFDLHGFAPRDDVAALRAELTEQGSRLDAVELRVGFAPVGKFKQRATS